MTDHAPETSQATDSRPASGSAAGVFIIHVFPRTIIVECHGLRIWLNREEAVQLLDKLPTAINKMGVK